MGRNRKGETCLLSGLSSNLGKEKEKTRKEKKLFLSPLNTPSIGGSCAAKAAQGGEPLPLARTRPSMRSPTGVVVD
jgi:hypothetical protein